MTNIRPLSVFVTSLLVFGAATSSQAAIYVPPGLNPGDTYHLAFVTSGRGYGAFDDIAGYNSYVQGEAALNPLLTGTDVGVIWKIIASTLSVHARDNALVEAPVYLLDGTKIADGFSDFWDGSMDVPLSLDQYVGRQDIFVWTGTFPDGTGGAEYSLGSTSHAIFGHSASPDRWWTTYSATHVSTLLPFYALSGMQTVPGSTVPEPASVVVWLCLASVLGLVGRYRRRTD